jgi:hypothetical protein
MLFGASLFLHIIFLLPAFVTHRFVAGMLGVDIKP